MEPSGVFWWGLILKVRTFNKTLTHVHTLKGTRHPSGTQTLFFWPLVQELELTSPSLSCRHNCVAFLMEKGQAEKGRWRETQGDAMSGRAAKQPPPNTPPSKSQAIVAFLPPSPSCHLKTAVKSWRGICALLALRIPWLGRIYTGILGRHKQP